MQGGTSFVYANVLRQLGRFSSWQVTRQLDHSPLISSLSVSSILKPVSSQVALLWLLHRGLLLEKVPRGWNKTFGQIFIFTIAIRMLATHSTGIYMKLSYFLNTADSRIYTTNLSNSTCTETLTYKHWRLFVNFVFFYARRDVQFKYKTIVIVSGNYCTRALGYGKKIFLMQQKMPKSDYPHVRHVVLIAKSYFCFPTRSQLWISIWGRFEFVLFPGRARSEYKVISIQDISIL